MRRTVELAGAWLLVLIFSVPGGATGVELRLGRGEELTRQRVLAPNLEMPVDGNWRGTADPYHVGVEPEVILSGKQAVTETDSGLDRHYQPACGRLTEGAQSAPMRDVLKDNNGPTSVAPADPPSGAAQGPLKIRGNGSGNRVARTDGSVTIRPYLTTWNEAGYVVRLFDADGKEILFDGKPLFRWQRKDDKSSQTAIFQGRPQPGSIRERAAGDWSPVEGLEYRFDIQAGQKIVVETSGKTAADSYLDVESPAF